MKRKCLEGDGCPVARALDVVGDWWTLLIIRDALCDANQPAEASWPPTTASLSTKQFTLNGQSMERQLVNRRSRP